MVLDVVVSASAQMLGDLRPSVPVRLMEFKNTLVLCNGPLDFLDVRVEVIVPSNKQYGTTKLKSDIRKNE